VSRALTGGATPDELPAAGVHGRRVTRWLLDAEAAAELDAHS
jgi:6-phosphogluconolactonase